MNPKGARKRPEQPRASPVDRLPPHSIEAEQGVLGCILIDPQIIVLTITELIGEETFYDLRHRTIYSTLVRMFDEGVPIDTITLVNRLKGQSALESVGGLSYLTELPEKTPSASNVKSYIDICNDKHQLRQLVAAATEIASDAYEEAVPVADQMDSAEHRILKVSSRTAGKGSVSARVLVGKAMTQLLEMEQAGTAVTGIPSGFIDMDRFLGGFNPKEMTVIAARPSVGKSSLLLNIADHIAVEDKIPVGILSLEMPAERMMQRMISSRARVNIRTLSAKHPGDATKLKNAADAIGKAPLYIDDERGMSFLKARAKARRMKVEHGIQILFVDYLQKLSAPETKRYDGRQQEIAQVSGSLFELAGELELPVVVLSQLNRELDKEKSRRPRLSDLKESGAIEQDADNVVLLWNNDTELNETTITVNVDVPKNRYGAPGHFKMMFFRTYTRFESAARETLAEQAEMYP